MTTPAIYRTAALVGAAEQIPQQPTFLRDRYFPTAASDLFKTQDVYIDFRDSKIKLAPVVIPRHQGVLVGRDAFKTYTLTPPFVAPMRTITLDNLTSRGFGEALYSDRTAEDREAALIARDIDDMNKMIDNREEMMCAALMLNSQVALKQYADKVDTDEYLEFDVRYYDGDANPNAYITANPWNGSGADIYADLTAIVRQLTAKGSACTDIVAHSSVCDAIISDEKFQKLLDIRNFHMGTIEPSELPDGVGFFGTINLGGKIVGLYSYDREIFDEQTKTTVPLIPEGSLIACAPDCGHMLYGAISQIEKEDEKFHTYASKRVPKFYTDSDNDVRSLRVASRPLPAPHSVYPWVSANVFA